LEIIKFISGAAIKIRNPDFHQKSSDIFKYTSPVGILQARGSRLALRGAKPPKNLKTNRFGPYFGKNKRKFFIKVG